MFFESEEGSNDFLNSLIRLGEVSSVDPSKGTARVVFDDDDSIVSADLPILQRNTLENKDFHSVTVGEDVLCVFLPSGPAAGFILGSVYAGEVEPPDGASESTRIIEFKSINENDSTKTRIVYDRENNSVSVDFGSGNTVITADRSSAKVKAGGVTFELKNNKATVDASGGIELKGDTTITGNLDVSGKAEVTGNVESKGDVKTATVSLNTHVHTGTFPPPAGTGTTNPPTPSA